MVEDPQDEDVDGFAGGAGGGAADELLVGEGRGSVHEDWDGSDRDPDGVGFNGSGPHGELRWGLGDSRLCCRIRGSENDLATLGSDDVDGCRGGQFVAPSGLLWGFNGLGEGFGAWCWWKCRCWFRSRGVPGVDRFGGGTGFPSWAKSSSMSRSLRRMYSNWLSFRRWRSAIKTLVCRYSASNRRFSASRLEFFTVKSAWPS